MTGLLKLIVIVVAAQIPSDIIYIIATNSSYKNDPLGFFIMGWAMVGAIVITCVFYTIGYYSESKYSQCKASKKASTNIEET